MKKRTAKTGAAIAAALVKSFRDKRAWESWLARKADKAEGVSIRLPKKSSAAKSVTYAEALEVALCYGWIDAQKQGGGDDFWLQRFMPRKPRSIWSKINREKALALIAAGAMKPRGLAEVERAQRDGRWEAAYDPPSTAKVPPDLQMALDTNRRARSFFEKLNSRNRYAILWRLQTAKKPETRAKRIQTFVSMLEKGETFH